MPRLRVGRSTETMCGQGALAGLVSGLYVPDRGSLVVHGQKLARHDVHHVIAAGIGRIPEDRHGEGTLGDMSTWGTR